MEWDYPSEEDLFQAENEKWNKIEKNIQELEKLNYFSPIENTLVAVEEIVNDSQLGLYKEVYFDDDEYQVCCHKCNAVKPITYSRYYSDSWAENFEHNENCPILKLRSLVNTLGDMIA